MFVGPRRILQLSHAARPRRDWLAPRRNTRGHLELLSRSSTSANSSNPPEPEPFYGRPRESHKNSNYPNSVASRTRLLVENIVGAVVDPTRADCVAAVGELTGEHTIRQLWMPKFAASPIGRRILNTKPVVSKATIPYERFMKEANEWKKQQQRRQDDDDCDDNRTFGQAYGCFLLEHGFDPDGRDPVRYLGNDDNHDDDDDENDDIAYLMLRYRQCHDFWHALTGLPPTVLGELALKELEFWQTRLPLTAGAVVLANHANLLENGAEQEFWSATLQPWARRVGQATPIGTLLSDVYYEEEWDTPLQELRERLHIEPAPVFPNNSSL